MSVCVFPGFARGPGVLLLVCSPMVGCFLVEGGGKGGEEGPSQEGGDSGEIPAWGTGEVRLEIVGGGVGEIIDPDGGDGPAFFTPDGELEQGIVTISEGLGEDFLDISLLSVDPGISAGATCHDFDHLEQSTGGCQWVSLGSGSLSMDDGSDFSAIDWTTTEGTLQVDALSADGEEGGWISFHFSFNLTDGTRTASVEGEVVDAWLSR
jgi:hypothetical protein